MTWTETQVRFLILGIFERWQSNASGVSVEQSLADIGGRIDRNTFSRNIVCRELEITEQEAEELMIQGGWDVQ